MTEEPQYIYSDGVGDHSNTIIIFLSIQNPSITLIHSGTVPSFLRLLTIPTTTVFARKRPIFGVLFSSIASTYSNSQLAGAGLGYQRHQSANLNCMA